MQRFEIEAAIVAVKARATRHGMMALNGVPAVSFNANSSIASINAYVERLFWLQIGIDAVFDAVDHLIDTKDAIRSLFAILFEVLHGLAAVDSDQSDLIIGQIDDEILADFGWRAIFQIGHLGIIDVIGKNVIEFPIRVREINAGWKATFVDMIHGILCDDHELLGQNGKIGASPRELIIFDGHDLVVQVFLVADTTEEQLIQIQYLG